MARLVGCVLVAVGLLGGLVPPARAAGDSVTLGLPERLLPATTVPPATLDTLVRSVLASWPCRAANCPGRPAVVNIALGTDYEILDWFGKGLLDLAVVPALGAYLLAYDKLDFVELTAGTAVPRPRQDETEQLERFSEWIWCGAQARATVGSETARRLLDGASVQAQPACGDSPGRGPGYELQLPSHFDGLITAVDVAASWLVARIGPWKREAPSRTAREILEDGFWREFLRHTRFTLGDTSEGQSGATPIRLTGSAPADRLILAGPAARRLGVAAPSARPTIALPAGAADLWGRSYEDATGNTIRSVPRPFRTLLFTEPAFGVRTFAFSPRESIELLRRHTLRAARVARPAGATPEPAAELALVLPGGGVKAAYQTTLIEHLYREGLLRNGGGSSREDRDAPVGVSYVIGTSGGALLGYFAARLTGSGPWHLETALWQRCDPTCRDMQSTDIFGYIDMPRYVSALATLIVFAIVLYFIRPAAAPAAAPAGARPWRLRLLLWTGPVLLGIPFLIRFVNGERWREHIPEVEGLAYALAVFLAMFADQCLLLDTNDHSARSPGWRAFGTILSSIGGAAVLAPAVIRWRGHAPWLDNQLTLGFTIFGRSLSIQAGALVVCFGGLLLLAGIIVRTWQSRGYRLVAVRGFVTGLAVGLLDIVLASFIVSAIVVLWPDGRWPFDHLSLLELTSDYWVALVAASVLAGLLLLVLRRFRGWGRILEIVAHGIDYLSHWLGRLVFHGALAVIWWNVVLAPGVYGNALALSFLTDTDKRFHQEYPDSSALQVPLIVTANALEVEGARYFAFLPAADTCLNVTRRSGYGATWLVLRPAEAPASSRARTCDQARDKLWTLEYLRSVVFASGSPYPVFPAHGVTGEKERLVDGGYANNVPLDAAQGIGADEVLIIESSNPLGHESAPGALAALLGAVRIHGDLVGNLPRLFTFLYERSQELDRISRRELLVVSLAPGRDERGWPSLVQFSGGVINKMRTTAERDWTSARRIGMVQSWGRPRFTYSVTAEAARSAPAR